MFVSEPHPGSRRFAVFEDDGTTGYLYLTEPNGSKIAKDCWVYNQIPAPEPSEIQSRLGGLPCPSWSVVSRSVRLEAEVESGLILEHQGALQAVALPANHDERGGQADHLEVIG
jgi:hypothetical protein